LSPIDDASSDPYKVTISKYLPTGEVSVGIADSNGIGLTQLRVILNRDRMVLSLGNLIQLRNSYGNYVLTGDSGFAGGFKGETFNLNLAGFGAVQDAPPGFPASEPPSASMNRSSGSVDTSISITGQNFPPRQPVSITFGGQQIVAAAVDSAGSFSVTFNVPRLEAGQYDVRAGSFFIGTFTITPTPLAAYVSQLEGDCRGVITFGNGSKMYYYRNFPFNTPNSEVTKAVIVIHGLDRKPLLSFNSMIEAAQSVGSESNSLIIVPHFKTGDDKPESKHLYWKSAGWKEGSLSVSSPRTSSCT
jgi:hypothetical protein